MLVATPYMDEAERCTDIAFMEGGHIPHRGTPAEVKALVPGVLFEVVAADPRAALTALASAPGVSSAHLYGDVVRVLSAPGGPDADGLLGSMREAGLQADAVRPAAVDMEAAFAFLAEQAGDAA